MKIKGKLLSAKMAMNGYTLDKTVELTGVSKATLSAVKNGKSCSFDTAAKIAKAFDIDIMELIENDN